MNPQKIKKIYDDFAKFYEKEAIHDKYTAYKELANLVLMYYKKRKANVLDLGCGTGLSSLVFFKKKFDVIGIDISKKMLKEARKHPYKKLICQDLERPLLVKDQFFDIIVLTGVMEFIEKPLSLFFEIKKKLKKEGVFALTVPQKFPKTSYLRTKLKRKSYSKRDIERIFAKSGFRLIKRKSILGYYRKVDGREEKSDFYLYILKNK